MAGVWSFHSSSFPLLTIFQCGSFPQAAVLHSLAPVCLLHRWLFLQEISTKSGIGSSMGCGIDKCSTMMFSTGCREVSSLVLGWQVQLGSSVGLPKPLTSSHRGHTCSLPYPNTLTPTSNTMTQLIDIFLNESMSWWTQIIVPTVPAWALSGNQVLMLLLVCFPCWGQLSLMYAVPPLEGLSYTEAQQAAVEDRNLLHLSLRKLNG